MSLALLTSCASSPDTIVLSADRQVIKQAGGWQVSDVWMQERYQLERALRLRLERCEAEKQGAAAPAASRVMEWP